MPETLAAAPSAPYPWLLADVGGSHARFAWLAGPDQAPQHVRTLAVHEYPGLLEAVRAYLAGLSLGGLAQGVERQPRSAALALAVPVTGDAVRFTNNPWSFSQRELQRALGLQRLQVLNDFEALALSLPRLRANQWQTLSAGSPDWSLPLAVVGPGTGLGIAGLVPCGSGWRAVAGEGGHATLAPHDDYESELLRIARQTHAHVSAERLLSGAGLPLLYRCVAVLEDERAVAEVDGRWVIEQALAGEDPLARRCIEVFCAMLGGFAGSAALTFGARGGVFIGGGIAPRLGTLFTSSAFRERFEAKGRYRDYLAAIPTALVTDTLVALDGAAQALAQA